MIEFKIQNSKFKIKKLLFKLNNLNHFPQSPQKTTDIICCLLLAFLVFAFFNSAAIGRDLILLGDFTGSDLLNLHYPFKVAMSESIRHFSLPLWLPNLSFGFPLFAEGQTGILYPVNLLFSLLPPYLALNWSILAAFITAGIGTYLYSRSLGFSPFAAFTSSIIFMFSAFFITRAKHLNMIAVASWVPLLFYFIKKLFTTLKWRWAIFSGVVIGMQFLAGHPQMTFFSILIISLYFLFEFWRTGQNKGFPSVFTFGFLSFLITITLGVSLAAIQILPTLELTQQGERTSWTLTSATGYPFSPKNLLTFISPYYFGNPATGSYRENVTLNGVFWENSSYIGLLPLLLAMSTLWATFRPIFKRKFFLSIILRRSSPSLNSLYHFFFLFVVVFSLVMMLGRFTPVFGFLWQNIPGFNLFRFPTRFNLFLIFSLSLLAGLSVQKLADKLDSLKFARSAPPTGGSESEEEFRLNWPFKKWQTQILIIAIILIDLFVFAQNYISKVNPSWFLKTPASAQFLAKDQDLSRYWSVTQYGQSPYQALGWKKPEPLVAIREALPPNDNLEYNLASFSDRGWFEGGLSSSRRNRLERFLLEENKNDLAMAKILGMFNVKYVLTFSPQGGFEMKEKASFDLGKEFGLPLKIFENQENMPRYYYVPEAVVIPDSETLFQYLTTNEQFLPTKTVLLENEPKQIPPAFKGTLEEFKKANPLTLEKYQNTEVWIKAKTTNHGFLVLSDLNYPGWKAKVDGKEKEILAANYLVRAIELTPGEHEIRFYYDPIPFKIGAGISGITLLILLSLIFFQNVHRFKRK